MRKMIKEIENIDLDELCNKIELEANLIEKNFIGMMTEGENAPPVFDFEINWLTYLSVSNHWIY